MTSTVTERTDEPAASLARAFATQLGGRVVGMVASVGTIAITTRHLGVDGFGLLTTVIVFVGLWTSLTELGVGAVIVRRVSGGDGDLGTLMGVNLGLSIVYCLPLGVLAAASGVLVYLDRPELRAALVVVSASLVLNTVASCFKPIFVATVRFTAVALADVGSRVASLLATLVVVALDGGLVWFAVVQLAAPAVLLVVEGAAAFRLQRFPVRFDRRQSFALLRESLPQTGVLVIAVLYWRADAVILTLVGTPRDVGAYGIAFTAAFTLSVLASFYLSSSLAEMTTRFATDRASFGAFVASGVQAMAFLGLPIAVVGGVLAAPLITLLGSAEFSAAAALPFALLLCCVALTFFTGVLSQGLFAAHDQIFLLRLNVANLAGNVALNLVLAPLFGATGAASALVTSEVIGLTVASWRLRRFGYHTPWPFLGRLCLPLVVAAGIAVALHGVASGWLAVAAAVAAGVAYVLVNLVAGPVRTDTVRTVLGRGEPDAAAVAP